MIVRYKMLLMFIFVLYAPYNYSMQKKYSPQKKKSTKYYNNNTNSNKIPMPWSTYTSTAAKIATLGASTWVGYKGFCEGNHTKLGIGIAGGVSSLTALLAPNWFAHSIYKIGEKAPYSPAVISFPLFWLAYTNRNNYATAGTLGALGITTFVSSLKKPSSPIIKTDKHVPLDDRIAKETNKQGWVTFSLQKPLLDKNYSYGHTLKKNKDLKRIDDTIRHNWNQASESNSSTDIGKLPPYKGTDVNGIGGIFWPLLNTCIKSLEQQKFASQNNLRIRQWPLIWRMLSQIGLCTYSPQYAPSDIVNNTTLRILALKYSDIINDIILQQSNDANSNVNLKQKLLFKDKLPKALRSPVTIDNLKKLIETCKSGKTNQNIKYTDLKQIFSAYLDAVTLVEKYLNDKAKQLLLIDDNKAVCFNDIALQNKSLNNEKISKIIDAIFLLRLKFNNSTLSQYIEKQKKDDSEEDDDDDSEEEDEKKGTDGSEQNPFSCTNLNSSNFYHNNQLSSWSSNSLLGNNIVKFLKGYLEYDKINPDIEWIKFGIQAMHHKDNEYYLFRFNPNFDPNNDIFTCQAFEPSTENWNDIDNFSDYIEILQNKSLQRVFIFSEKNCIPKKNEAKLWYHLQY